MDQTEFLETYCNWEQLNTIHLTFDIDWAPDFMIDSVMSLLESHEAKASFFLTHPSEFVAQKMADSQSLFEFGLHPNLNAGSTQGGSFDEIMATLNGINPGAKSLRFHTLTHSYRDLLRLKDFGITTDISRINYQGEYLMPCHHRDLAMTLMTYSWEDGVCENTGDRFEIGNCGLDTPGLKILNFHPMNVYLNTSCLEDRKRFQAEVPNLLTSTKEQVEPYRCEGAGAGAVLKELLVYAQAKGVKLAKISETSEAFGRV